MFIEKLHSAFPLFHQKVFGSFSTAHPKIDKKKDVLVSWISNAALQPGGVHLTPYLTLPYHTLPYPTLPYLTLPYHTLPYLTLPYLTLPYPTIPYLTLPYLSLPYLTLPSYLKYIRLKSRSSFFSYVPSSVTDIFTPLAIAYTHPFIYSHSFPLF